MLKGHRKPLRELIARCSRCGLCRAVCPVFLQVNQEPAVARGKLQLIEALFEEQLNGTEHLAHLLSRCLVCGLCEQVCPAGVKIPEAILRARSELVRSLDLTGDDIRTAHPSIARWNRYLQAIRSSPGFPLPAVLSLLGELGQRGRPSQVVEKMSPMTTYQRTRPRDNSLTVGYFPGCADRLNPRVFRAAQRISTRLGVNLVVPDGVACCGLPFIEAGDFGLARELAIENIKAYEDLDIDAIVVGCSAGGRAFKRYYLELLGLTGFPLPVYDLGEFLRAMRSQIGDIPSLPIKVCYILPQDRTASSPHGGELLSHVPDMELTVLEGNSRCTGSLFFAIVHPELYQRMLKKAVESVVSTGCAAVVTEDPMSLMMLQLQLERTNQSVKVLHLAELIDLALPTRDPSPPAARDVGG